MQQGFLVFFPKEYRTACSRFQGVAGVGFRA